MRSFPLYQFLCHIMSNNVKLDNYRFLDLSMHKHPFVLSNNHKCAHDDYHCIKGPRDIITFTQSKNGKILFRQSYSSCNNLCMLTTYFYSTRLKHTFGKSTNIHKLFKTINYLNNRIDTTYEMLMTYTHIYSKSSGHCPVSCIPYIYLCD